MKHTRFNMRKTVIYLVFYSIAGLLFSQTAMQLLTTIESPFATDTYNWGSKIKGGGNINGDGYDDIVLAGIPLESKDGRKEVYIYLGGNTQYTEPDYIITDPSDQAITGSRSSFASNIAYNGDLNGDGYCDLVISDSIYGYEGEDEWGRVYIYFGGPDFSTTPDLILDGQDYMGSHRGNICFGYKIDISGDFNGDGYNDLVVSSAHEDLAHYGQADIFFGGPDFDTESDWAYYGDICEQFASSFAVGDINGDGFSDLAAMSTNYGYHTDGVMQELKIFLGGHDFNTQADAVYELEQDHTFATLLMDGDINHDGFDDLVIRNSASKILYGGSEFPDELEDLILPDPESNPRAYVVSNDSTFLWTVRDNWIEGFMDHRLVSLNSEGEYVTAYQLLYYPEHMRGCAFGYLLGDVNNDGNPDILVTNKVNDSIVFNIMTTHYEPDSVNDAVSPAVINFAASPNPFNASAKLSYEIKEPDNVSLSVYNLKGQLVANLDAGYKGSGKHSIIRDGKDHSGRKLSSGVDFLRLKWGKKFITTKKVTLCY